MPDTERPLEDLNASDLDEQKVAQFETTDFDKLPFGVIRLSHSGEILTYNAAEADLARRSVGKTVGRNFFTDVAPCCDNPRFRGVLEEMRANKERSRVFDYRFAFRWGHKDVRIRFLNGGESTTWVFVTPLADHVDVKNN